jgi:predicted protein tyrosine phosphatase
MLAPFRLTVCGIDELDEHGEARVSHVLSILDPGWPVPTAFGAFGEHERLELRFHDVIEDQPGMISPRLEDVESLLAFGRDLATEPPPDAHLLVHCHAGVSRSTAAMAVILAQALPASPAEAVFDELLRIRPGAWPNLRIVELADALLDRHGELVAAAHGVYRRQVVRRPDLVAAMRSSGRAREVAMVAADRVSQC